jgi:hypothetical protein
MPSDNIKYSILRGKIQRPLRHFVTPPPNPSEFPTGCFAIGEEGRGASSSHEPETTDGGLKPPRLGRAGAGQRVGGLRRIMSPKQPLAA